MRADRQALRSQGDLRVILMQYLPWVYIFILTGRVNVTSRSAPRGLSRPRSQMKYHTHAYPPEAESIDVIHFWTLPQLSRVGSAFPEES